MASISDNAAYSSWGCEQKDCAAFLYRAKPKPPEKETLVPVAQIAGPK